MGKHLDRVMDIGFDADGRIEGYRLQSYMGQRELTRQRRPQQDRSNEMKQLTAQFLVGWMA